MNTHTVIIDEGSAQIKLTTLESSNVYVSPSRVVLGHTSDASKDSYVSDRAYTTEEGRELSVSAEAEAPRTTSTGREYQLSDDNLVLVHDALRENNFGGELVDLYVTLPIDLFFEKSPINKELIDKKKERLLKRLTHVNNQPLAAVNAVSVLPEGIPVVYDILLNEDGSNNTTFDYVERILVVDIGGTTTDIALYSTNGDLLKRFGSNSAMFPVRKRIAELMGKPVSPIIMDRVLKTGQYKQEDVSAHIDKAASEHAEAIVKDIYASVTDMASIDLIAIAGGGAALMGKHIQSQFDVKTVIPDNPDHSIVRGIRKYLLGRL